MTDRILGPGGRPIAQGVVGPDGLPVNAPRIALYGDELVHKESYDGLPVKQSMSQLRMRMARFQRDGGSMQALIAKFDLVGEARNPFILERALRVARAELEQAIADGREPLETPPGYFDDEGGVTAGPEDD